MSFVTAPGNCIVEHQSFHDRLNIVEELFNVTTGDFYTEGSLGFTGEDCNEEEMVHLEDSDAASKYAKGKLMSQLMFMLGANNMMCESEQKWYDAYISIAENRFLQLTEGWVDSFTQYLQIQMDICVRYNPAGDNPEYMNCLEGGEWRIRKLMDDKCKTAFDYFASLENDDRYRSYGAMVGTVYDCMLRFWKELEIVVRRWVGAFVKYQVVPVLRTIRDTKRKKYSLQSGGTPDGWNSPLPGDTDDELSRSFAALLRMRQTDSILRKYVSKMTKLLLRQIRYSGDSHCPLRGISREDADDLRWRVMSVFDASIMYQISRMYSDEVHHDGNEVC
jgi:hypothetical protein